MPNALFVIHGPAFGGAHMQVARLGPRLAERGWQSLVLLPTEPGNAATRLREAGVAVETMPMHRLRATPRPGPHVRLAAGFGPEVRRIRELIRARSIDLVQVHGPTNPHGAIAAHLERAAVVWQLLDTRAPMPLRRVTMPLVIRIADAVTTWGKALADAHPGTARLGERAVTVVPPVDSAEFDPASRELARERLHVGGDRCVVGTVGVRNPQKGHEFFVRAAARVRDRFPACAFRIIGGPSPAHPDYEKRVRQESRDLGLDSAETFDLVDPGGEVSKFVTGLDVFAMTSVPRSEGMPTAILEAMACGLPVVATDVGAVAELVEEGVTGFVVRPNDPSAIAGALVRLVHDPELRRTMGARARERALTRYGLEQVADTHARAFELAVAHRRERRWFGSRAEVSLI